MALPDSALTTLNEVKRVLGIGLNDLDEDITLERYIRVASNEFEQKTSREYGYVTGHTEDVSSDTGRILQVKQKLPIDSINSIEKDTGNSTDTVDSTNYEIQDAQAGQIRRTQGYWDNTSATIPSIEPIQTGEDLTLYTVDYDGGFVTPQQDANDSSLSDDLDRLPPEIENAVISRVVDMYRSQGRDSNIRKESILDASVTYETDRSAKLTEFDQVVNMYKRHPIA